jgi:GT2 family glycosyltransferase
LDKLLASLDRVAHPRDRLQVIVAVDGPDPALADIGERYGAHVVTLPENGGSYAARNLALSVLAPSVTAVLFTDTDCEVDPAWVTAHLAALETTELSGGGVEFLMSDPPAPAEWVDSCRHLRQQHFVEQLGYAATCNLAVRRDAVDALRFDDRLRSGGDLDFGQRAKAAGLRITYTPQARIYHPARRRARSVLRKVWRVAGGAQEFGRRGQSATDRRDPTRGRAAARARAAELPVTQWWLLRVAALDAACSVAYATRVPGVIGPAIRRRLARST